MVGLAIIFAQRAFRVPEDLFLDHPDSVATEFLFFLKGATMAPSPAPVIMATIHQLKVSGRIERLLLLSAVWKMEVLVSNLTTIALRTYASMVSSSKSMISIFSLIH